MTSTADGATTWHITFGTYGARLHGSARPTVDRQHNQRGEAFVPTNRYREEAARLRQKFARVTLQPDQRQFIEASLPAVCHRGGWRLRTCAARPDHVHVVLDIPTSVHGEEVRRLIKRWLGQALSVRWPLPDGATWWAEQGSNKAIHDLAYLERAMGYVEGQRTTAHSERGYSAT